MERINKIIIIAMYVICMFEIIFAQRGHYAGSRPSGYHDKYKPAASIDDRFQPENSVASGTPQRLPVNAHGDAALVDRLSNLPTAQQPFWFLNYQQLEAQRGPFPAAPANNQQQNLNGIPPVPVNNNNNLGGNILDNRFSNGVPSYSILPIVQGVSPQLNG